MKSPDRTAHVEGEGGRAYLFMLLSSLAFASMGALSHLAGERCDWHLVAVARGSLAFVFTLSLSLAAGVRLVLFRPALLWVRSVAGSFGVLFAFYALTHLPVSTALTLSNTVPVWVTLLAWPVLGQRPRASVWVAVAAGLAGIVLIQRPEAGGERLAAALALANALSTSISMIGLNRLGGVDARAVVTHFSGVATVFTVGFMLLSGGRVDYAPLGDARTLALLLGVGALGDRRAVGDDEGLRAGEPLARLGGRTDADRLRAHLRPALLATPVRPARRLRHRPCRRPLGLAHAALAPQKTVGRGSHDGLRRSRQ